MERDVFNLSIERMEAGERPGWIDRMIFVLEGEYVTLRFDVQWRISKRRAWLLIAKIRLSQWKAKLWDYK